MNSSRTFAMGCALQACVHPPSESARHHREAPSSLALSDAGHQGATAPLSSSLDDASSSAGDRISDPWPDGAPFALPILPVRHACSPPKLGNVWGKKTLAQLIDLQEGTVVRVVARANGENEESGGVMILLIDPCTPRIPRTKVFAKFNPGACTPSDGDTFVLEGRVGEFQYAYGEVRGETADFGRSLPIENPRILGVLNEPVCK